MIGASRHSLQRSRFGGECYRATASFRKVKSALSLDVEISVSQNSPARTTHSPTADALGPDDILARASRW